jgi:hypothetical protein
MPNERKHGHWSLSPGSITYLLSMGRTVEDAQFIVFSCRNGHSIIVLNLGFILSRHMEHPQKILVYKCGVKLMHLHFNVLGYAN